MKWSWKIARISDIDVSIHVTFPLLLLWIGLSYWQHTHSVDAVIEGIALILVLFGCVVLHEFGHALTARRFGTRTRSITLLPIGGVAAMERMPADPRQEMLVAAAGPCVNLVIAALLWAWYALNPVNLSVEDALASDIPFMYRVMVMNLMLAVFNMLPAFPMDGGRVLRAGLAVFMARDRATQVAASVGQGFAAMLFFLGILYNPFLMLIAVFIWLGASAESTSEKMHSALFKASAGQSMITQFDLLHPGDPLQKAVDLTLHSTQKHFPVAVDAAGPEVKLLSQKMLLQGLRTGGERLAIGELPLEPLTCFDETQGMDTLLERLGSRATPLVGVTRQGTLVGVIDLENVLELINIEEAIKAHRGAQGTRAM